MERVFTFTEPHMTGGHCVVIITEEQILKYMNKLKKEYPEYADADDNELIREFCTIHWCSEVT